MLLLAFLGCNRLDAVNDLASPVVAQGMFLGLQVPDGVSLDDAEGFEYAALCNMFLAYVGDPSELADAPVEGATITFRSPENGRLTFREEGDGKYTLDSTDGLVYKVGDEPIISFEQDGVESSLQVLAPEAPDVDVPGSLQREKPLTVDLSDYTYANAVAATYDVDRGKMTWDNLPTGVDEIYTFTHEEGPIQELVIPRDAFLRQSTYVVGVAGMQVADPLDFEGVNTSLSAFVAGRLSVSLLAVTD